MEELEYIMFLDQVEKLGELAEFDEQGLTLDSLNFADFWINVEVAA